MCLAHFNAGNFNLNKYEILREIEYEVLQDELSLAHCGVKDKGN